MTGKGATSKSGKGTTSTNSVRKRAITPAVIGAVVSSFFLVFFESQPQVPTSTSQAFFDNYYRQVTQADQRKTLYQEDLTIDFQKSPGVSWNVYNNWWSTQKQVVVNEVESVSGNPLEFTVWLTYYPVQGTPKAQVIRFSLVCSGFWAGLQARIPTWGCPPSHLQIQSSLDVTPTQ